MLFHGWNPEHAPGVVHVLHMRLQGLVRIQKMCHDGSWTWTCRATSSESTEDGRALSFGEPSAMPVQIRDVAVEALGTDTQTASVTVTGPGCSIVFPTKR
mmetsp:Transcript_27142/g.36603  ORF Transcript_27142/g.36603 Transcript_27142/m.36603 type:complete len:100 (+) Transcript_27142:584-883(+)